ncbi:WD40 repeat domain-containing protein [Bacteroidota bacterium]
MIIFLMSGCGKMALEPVAAVCYSPDGKYILAETSEFDKPGLIVLIEQATGKTVKKMKGHSLGVLSVDLSKDGKYVLSGSIDKMVKVWDIEKGKELLNLEGHTDEVAAVKFSPDGKTALSCGKDGTIRMWDLSTGSELLNINENEEIRTKKVFNVDFSPDGKLLLSASGGALRLWDASSGNLVRSFTTDRHHYSESNNWYKMGACFSPDGNYVVTGVLTRVYMFDLESGEQVREFTGRKSNITSVCFSPDGKYIYAAGPGPIWMWDVETGEKVRQFKEYEDLVTIVISASKNGEYLLSGGIAKLKGEPRIGSIQLWDIYSGDVLNLYETL